MGIQGLHSALAPLVLRRAAVKEVARLLREAAPEQGAPGADTEPTGCQEVAAEDHTGDAAPDRDGLPAPSKRSAGTVAVDGFSWLHKGAYGSALQVARGSPAPGVIKYCMRRVAALRDAGLEPLVSASRRLRARDAARSTAAVSAPYAGTQAPLPRLTAAFLRAPCRSSSTERACP